MIALNNLAQTLSDEGRNTEALEIIERAAAAAGPHAGSGAADARAHTAARAALTGAPRAFDRHLP